jgi:hypothetical protein
LTNNSFDEFLNEATHAVHDLWVKAGGKKLDTDELYDLNDTLTAFFSSRREDP